MAQSRQAIQARIASVNSTKKITRAMQLVASSKLTKQKNAMENNRPYSESLQRLLTAVLEESSTSNIYLQENEGKPAYVFVITSDMGLCGAYNANVYRMIQSDIKPDDRIVMVGIRGVNWLRARKGQYTIEDELPDLHEDISYEALSEKMQEALDLFEKKEISSIKVLYTHFKNTLTFIPVLETILPIHPDEREEHKGIHAQTIFEPSEDKMMSVVVPMVSKSLIYSRYLESKTSEQASRRMAMESATDNADELQRDLEFQFNQARQAAITQEITEIVGGANALA